MIGLASTSGDGRASEIADSELLEAAKAVLDANWVGRSTVPSRHLYPHQWRWDSAFIAIGRSWYDQERAQAELESLFAGQWSDGRVPHIVFNPDVPADAYFPGPTFWRSSDVAESPVGLETSGLVQPPLHAWAVRGPRPGRRCIRGPRLPRADVPEARGLAPLPPRAP